MKYGAWNVVWKVTDNYDLTDEGDDGVEIGVYDNAERAARVALEHEHAPMLSVQMQLYKDEWMDKVIR